MKLKNYFAELKRRNVFKAAVAYLVLAWLIVQVLSIVLPTFNAPPSFLKNTILVLAICFPFWIIFAWIYELTPEGLKKTIDVNPEASIMQNTGSRINIIIIVCLSLAVMVLLIDRFTNNPVKVVDIGNKGIAVLAFADMSPKKDHEYFSDGISEELLNILARNTDLRVISRTSSFSYKTKNSTAEQIGKELNVSHILEGSIRKSGNTVRITAQLINANDGSHEWSQTYDRNLDSIFKIQDEIAMEVSQKLESSLLGISKNKSSPPKTEAYNLFLQAKHLVNQNTKESYLKAEELIQKSILVDSTYSESWDLLAHIYETGSYNFDIDSSDSSLEKGLEAAKRSISLDATNAEAYATLASIQSKMWQFEEAEKSLQKALDLSPNDAVLIGTAALMNYGNLEESVVYLEKAIALDPLVYTNYFNLSFAYYRLGRLDDAMNALKTYETYYPNSQIINYLKALILLDKGLNEEALVEIQKEKHEFFSLYGKNFVIYSLGGQKATETIFNEFINTYSHSEPANMADLYAYRGKVEKAFEWLNIAYQKRDPVLLEALTYPSFRLIHKDPRWTQLIEKLELPDNHGYYVE